MHCKQEPDEHCLLSKLNRHDNLDKSLLIKSRKESVTAILIQNVKV